jgi:hypothetical protein
MQQITVPYYQQANLMFRPLLPVNSHQRCYLDCILPLLMFSRILGSVAASRFTHFPIPTDWRPEVQKLCEYLLGRGVVDYREEEPKVRILFDAIARQFLSDQHRSRPRSRLSRDVDVEDPDLEWVPHSALTAACFLFPLLYEKPMDVKKYTTRVSNEGVCDSHGTVKHAKHFASFSLSIDPVLGFPVSTARAGVEARALMLTMPDLKNYNFVEQRRLHTCPELKGNGIRVDIYFCKYVL